MESATFIDGGNGQTSDLRLGERPNASRVIPVKLQVALWVSSLMTALIALIISVVSMRGACVNVNVPPGSQTGSSASLQDDKIWTLAIHHSSMNLEYTDKASGEIRGFNADLVNAVCKYADKNCQLVNDYYKRCWNKVKGEPSRGGDGLFGRYYDGCIGWHHTYERARVFRFSDPWSQTKPGAFYVKPGNPRSFDWRNLTGKTIGFMDGTAFDEYCIGKVEQIQGNLLKPEQIRTYHTKDDLINAILNEDVDASFDFELSYKAIQEIEQISDDIRECVVAGMGMMVLKDSLLPTWWNPALKHLMESHEYSVICDDLNEKHGHWPGPSPEEFCIGY